MIRTTAARIHPWLAGLFALGVLLQAFLAGAALPQLGGSGDFAPIATSATRRWGSWP